MNTKLQVGDVIQIPKDGTHIIWFCNESRAAAIPEDKAPLLQWREREGHLQFRPSLDTDSINISANSEVEILRRLGRKGLVELIEQSNNNKGKEKPVKKSEKKEGSRGKLGQILGHSVVSVIRVMGKAGWSAERAMAACNKAGIEPHEATIKRQLYLGGKGEGELASISLKELEALAPKSAEKAAKKTEKTEKAAKKTEKTEKAAPKSAEKAAPKSAEKAAKKTKKAPVEEDAPTDDASGE